MESKKRISDILTCLKGSDGWLGKIKLNSFECIHMQLLWHVFILCKREHNIIGEWFVSGSSIYCISIEACVRD